MGGAYWDVARARVRRLATVALCCLGSGCSLILDFGGDLADAGPPTAEDGGFACNTADEPNDTQNAGVAITAGTREAGICPRGDVDFYTFAVDGAQDVVAQIRFDNNMGLGDLDMLLFSQTGEQLQPEGDGFGDVETIERSELTTEGRLAAGTYALRVFAFDNQRENNYTLSLTLDPPGGAGPDAGLPDAAP